VIFSEHGDLDRVDRDYVEPTTGCDRISPGCDHCYALTLAGRLKAMGQPKYQRDGDPRTSGPGFGVTLHPDALLEQLRWHNPRKVFVDSMADLSVGWVTGRSDACRFIASQRRQSAARLCPTAVAYGVSVAPAVIWCARLAVGSGSAC
jgi:protein gp37